jgi:hypothetical protein
MKCMWNKSRNSSQNQKLAEVGLIRLQNQKQSFHPSINSPLYPSTSKILLSVQSLFSPLTFGYQLRPVLSNFCLCSFTFCHFDWKLIYLVPLFLSRNLVGFTLLVLTMIETISVKVSSFQLTSSLVRLRLELSEFPGFPFFYLSWT